MRLTGIPGSGSDPRFVPFRQSTPFDIHNQWFAEEGEGEEAEFTSTLQLREKTLILVLESMSPRIIGISSGRFEGLSEVQAVELTTTTPCPVEAFRTGGVRPFFASTWLEPLTGNGIFFRGENTFRSDRKSSGDILFLT